jgi:hypothetical protein
MEPTPHLYQQQTTTTVLKTTTLITVVSLCFKATAVAKAIVFTGLCPVQEL